MIVDAKDIWKIYPMGSIEVQALRGVSLQIEEGEFVCIAGRSGSGKTTLMNIIGLIDTFDRGSLEINGQQIKNQSRKEMAKLRREFIGFIFQSFNLLPVLNVFENVEIPLIIAKKGNKAQRRERVNYLLEEVGLAQRARHTPSELSGGQQQRVAVARALVAKPRIVIADEPTANLDSATGDIVLDLMKKINREEKTTFIFSTHDSDIWKMADKIIFLSDGLIKEGKT